MSPNEIVLAAVDEYEESVARMEEAQQRVKETRARLGQAVVQATAGLPSEERMRVATWAYWNTEAPVPELCEASGLGQKFLSRVGPAPSGVDCQSCGVPLYATSRSARQAIVLAPKRRAEWVRHCSACLERRHQAKTAELAEQDALLRATIERLSEMPYRDYLQTQHWQDTRRSKLRSSGYRCQLCNQGGTLDVHHRTYERRGCEEMADLIVLCRPCHSKFHGKPVAAGPASNGIYIAQNH
jgi:5-methylcytosine-specific restriction endonuclease McrA